jgi:hypothetical protein
VCQAERARLEGDQAAGGVDVLVGRPDGIDTRPPGEVFGRTGDRCLLACAGDGLRRRGSWLLRDGETAGEGEHDDGRCGRRA